MTLKRVVLSLLTLLAIAFVCLSLAATWNRPQEQTRLDLLQTDLLLKASEWKTDDLPLKSLLLDSDSKKLCEQALLSYQTARDSNQRVIAELDSLISRNSTAGSSYRASRKTKEELIGELDLRIGLLQVRLGKTDRAISTWGGILKDRAERVSKFGQTAAVLEGLWDEPTLLLPDAEGQIRQNLDGWFQAEALKRLYRQQQREDMLPTVQNQQQAEAESAINRLALVNSIPAIGGLLGLILLIFLGIQRLFFPQSSPLKLGSDAKGWQVPWTSETTWEAIVLWFAAYIVMSQVILPGALSLLGLNPQKSWSYLAKALMVFLPYVLSMAPMLVILPVCLKDFLPLPEHWFRFSFRSLKWIGWGIGGYLAAVPLVLIASVISQWVLQGQGGGNPLLPILVESQSRLAKLILWSTLAIAAPFFEELLFRGFLLPSLTKFLPLWGAIAFSGFCFALAHLNFADLLPLTVLGCILGFVYARSKNLLAPMLLHSLWNSGSFLALLALGGK